MSAAGTRRLRGIWFMRPRLAVIRVPAHGDDVPFSWAPCSGAAASSLGKGVRHLLDRGQIRLHPGPDPLREAIAATAVASYADSRQVSVVADTRDHAAMLNAAIRGQLVAAGRGHDALVVTTAAGERIGGRRPGCHPPQRPRRRCRQP